MIKWLIILNLISFSWAKSNSNFQSLDQQIKHADGLFYGHFLKSKTVKLEDGQIATQMIFKMTKELGLQSELFGMDEIIVHYPAGLKKDRTNTIEGVPEFTVGEKVMIFIRSSKDRYWGMNLGYGSYKVINYGNEIVLVNYSFPHHSQFGQVNLQEFERKVKSIKGSSLKGIENPHLLSLGVHQQRGRTIASIKETKEDGMDLFNESLADEQKHYFSVMWLGGILSFLGGVFRLQRQRSRNG